MIIANISDNEMHIIFFVRSCYRSRFITMFSWFRDNSDIAIDCQHIWKLEATKKKIKKEAKKRGRIK